jgi:hypothetical protein
MSGGYAVASTASQRRMPRITGANQIKRARSIQTVETRTMKLSIRERIRNWLMKDNDECELAYAEDCESVDLHSRGFRLQVFSASGGTIVETTKYDRKSDENRHSLHVVTEDKDLGEELAKIITMEQLR